MHRTAMFALLAVLTAGCSKYGSRTLDVDPADIPLACAAYTACVDTEGGLSTCLSMVDTFIHIDFGRMSVILATADDADFASIMSLAQNAGCVVAAGGDCGAVRSCLDRGRAETGCTIPQGEDTTRSCSGDELVVCADLDWDLTAWETSVDCAGFGLDCVVVQVGEDGWAMCAESASGTTAGAQVTCQGSLARIQIANAVFTMDCGFYDASCVPGTYADIERFEYCEGKGPACDPDNFDTRCDGTRLVQCLGGKEVRMNCGDFGRVCRTVEGPYYTMTTCTFPECNPGDFDESCQEGVITYCGREGESTLSCVALGFSGCRLDGIQASCVE